MKLLTLILTLYLVAFAPQKTLADEDKLVKSSLLEAAVAGDREAMQKAVQDGANIDVQNVNGWSAVTFTASNGDLASAQFLIDLGANLNTVNDQGLTPLMIAANQNDKEMVELLLRGNASPLIKTSDGTTAFTMAKSSGRQVVALIIAEAAVLHAMASYQSDDVLDYLRKGAFIDIRNGAGYTPLIFAASTGNLTMVEQITKMGADCNRVENDGWSALHFAAVGGFESIVKVLLHANAAPGIVTNDGRTARSMAEVAGFPKIRDLIPDVIESNI